MKIQGDRDLKNLPLAEESPKVQKARAKKREELERQTREINEGNLRNKSGQVQALFARNASVRVTVPNKALKVFDGNENSVGPSQKIIKLMQQLSGSTSESK